MEKWEYTGKMPDMEISLMDWLNVMGQDGWELVTKYNQGFIFKRMVVE